MRTSTELVTNIYGYVQNRIKSTKYAIITMIRLASAPSLRDNGCRPRLLQSILSRPVRSNLLEDISITAVFERGCIYPLHRCRTRQSTLHHVPCPTAKLLSTFWSSFPLEQSEVECQGDTR